MEGRKGGRKETKETKEGRKVGYGKENNTISPNQQTELQRLVNTPLAVINLVQNVLSMYIRENTAKKVISLCKQETFINWYTRKTKPTDY